MSANKLIAFGIPWTALGPGSMWSDSGFLLVYEMLKKLHELYGTVGVMPMDPRYRETFEENNDPEVSGVWGVFNTKDRVSARMFDFPIDNWIANSFLATGRVCPSDFMFTNLRYIGAYLSLLGDDRFSRHRCPLYIQPTMSGKEGMNTKIPDGPFKRLLQMEACTYMLASRVFWVTTEQRARGYAICKRYLSSVQFKEIKDSHRIIGGGITELVKPHALSDKQVCKRLQTKQNDFRVSFVGRFTANKNPSFIFDTLVPLFALHSIKLEVVSVGTMEVPDAGYKRLRDREMAETLIGFHETGGNKGREYYAGEILPRLQVGISATIIEAHPSIPREGVYIGIPWLLPDRPWARAMFQDEYPFYYDGEAELIAQIKRIRDGKITDKECKQFNACRHNRDMIEFMEDTAAKVHECAKEDSRNFVNFAENHSYGNIEKAWEDIIPVGSEFIWSELPKIMRKYKGKLITLAERPQTRSIFDVFTKFRDRIECINPLEGVFRRTR